MSVHQNPIISPRESCFPTSYNQERFLAGFEWQQVTGKNFQPFQIVDAFSIAGELHADALEAALNRVLARHSELRASFFPDPDIPESERHAGLGMLNQATYLPRQFYWQSIAREAYVQLERDADCLSRQDVARLLGREALRRFEFSRAPLVRATLVKSGVNEHLMVLTVHHLIGDIGSLRIILRELQAFYEELVLGKPAVLPTLEADYEGFAAWQHRALPSSPSLEFWKKAWATAERGQLGYQDFPFCLPPGDSPAPTYEEIRLEENDLACLRSGTQAAGASLPALLLAALGVVLYHWTRRSVISIWNNFANRKLPEIQYCVGWFVNSQLVPLDLSGDPTIAEVCRRARVAFSIAARHQHIPSSLIWRNLQAPPRFSDLRIQFHYTEEEADRPSGPHTITRLPIAQLIRSRVPMGLEILAIDDQRSLSLIAGFLENRLPRVAARKLLQAMGRVATMMVREPQIKLSAMRLTG